MINAIIEFSAKNKIIVLILLAAAVMGGLWSMRTVPLDALPDMSDTQVIVYSRWDRSPDIMEDQVTYPLVTAMLRGGIIAQRHPREQLPRLRAGLIEGQLAEMSHDLHGVGPVLPTSTRAKPHGKGLHA